MLSKSTTSKFHSLNALFIPNSMCKILLIEDEDSIRRVLKKVLFEDNDSYQFAEAKDGQEGVSLIKNQSFGFPRQSGSLGAQEPRSTGSWEIR